MKRYSLFAIVVLLFFVIIGFSLISIYSSAEEHKQDLIDRGIEDKIFLAKSINNSLLSYETQDFFINEMAKYKDVEYIQVLDNKGVVYETSIKQDLGKVIEDKDIFGVRDDGKLIHFLFPLRCPSEPLWHYTRKPPRTCHNNYISLHRPEVQEYTLPFFPVYPALEKGARQALPHRNPEIEHPRETALDLQLL